MLLREGVSEAFGESPAGEFQDVMPVGVLERVRVRCVGGGGGLMT